MRKLHREVMRLLDSAQLTAKHSVATPVNWKPGEDVIIPTYLRLVSQPKN
jgi:alkyl hydroperoxide reductase subunit AhpC